MASGASTPSARSGGRLRRTRSRSGRVAPRRYAGIQARATLAADCPAGAEHSPSLLAAMAQIASSTTLGITVKARS